MVRQRTKTCDVLVAGGGMAGLCAAIGASRQGVDVILLQDRPMLGGNASSEIRMHILGAAMSGQRPQARETGIIEAIRLEDAVRNPQRSPSLFDLILWEQARAEPHLELLLNTTLDGARMAAPDRIATVHASRPSTEEAFTISAHTFIDCTGDGRLGIEAGADYRVGREARSEFQESLAPEKADQKVLGSSILFMAREHDRPMPFHAPAWARPFQEEDLKHRPHDHFEYGYWWIEWGGTLDTISDNEEIRDELWSIALGLWDHVKNHRNHGADRWALEWVGMLPGKRESRRFLGDYVLTQRDVQSGTPFHDRVAYGGWPIDTHPPAGIDASNTEPCNQIPVPLYSIPLRSLYSRNVSNLLMAGRNMSATHIAFASTRVMATCAVMGQAAGTAAALCVRDGLTPRELAAPSHVDRLQQTLLKDDATILLLAANDPEDLAPTSHVSASCHLPGHEPASVIDGYARPGDGVSHQWRSDPNQPFPQWLELSLTSSHPVNEIHLTFDSGFTRPLMLTHLDSLDERIIRGPQPETAREYTIEAHIEGNWRRLLNVQDNHQRKVVHHVDEVALDALRLTVGATHGVHEARVFEVRLYGPSS